MPNTDSFPLGNAEFILVYLIPSSFRKETYLRKIKGCFRFALKLNLPRAFWLFKN